MGPHPKTATVERRERSRSPRDRVVARRRRDRKKECACRRSIHPSSGGRNCCCRDGRWRQSPVGSPADAKVKAPAKETHKPGRSNARAGTNNTALFDIVNRDNGQRFALRAATSHARVPAECSERSCASGTRAGTQRKNRGAQHDSAGDPFVWPRIPGLASLGRDTNRVSAAPSARAGATHPRCDRAPRSRRSAAPRRIRVASLPRSFAACPRGRRRSSDWRGCRARRA